MTKAGHTKQQKNPRLGSFQPMSPIGGASSSPKQPSCSTWPLSTWQVGGWFGRTEWGASRHNQSQLQKHYRFQSSWVRLLYPRDGGNMHSLREYYPCRQAHLSICRPHPEVEYQLLDHDHQLRQPVDDHPTSFIFFIYPHSRVSKRQTPE